MPPEPPSLPTMLPPNLGDVVMASPRMNPQAKAFLKELFNIDKDIPRCDRDYK